MSDLKQDQKQFTGTCSTCGKNLKPTTWGDKQMFICLNVCCPSFRNPIGTKKFDAPDKDEIAKGDKNFDLDSRLF
jgi:hypothetical protein